MLICPDDYATRYGTSSLWNSDCEDEAYERLCSEILRENRCTSVLGSAVMVIFLFLSS